MSFEKLKSIVKRLLGPDGCMWDHAQDYASISQMLCSESIEVQQATDNYDIQNLKEELGDVLFLIFWLLERAEKDGLFTRHDVEDTVCNKLVRRHPHVFGHRKASSASEAMDIWQEIKRLEKANKT